MIFGVAARLVGLANLYSQLVGILATPIICGKILVFVGARYKRVRKKKRLLLRKSTDQYRASLILKESCTHLILPPNGLRSLLSAPPRVSA